MSSLVLMENAAQGAAKVALRMLARMRTRRCVLACGPGNNGGDALAIARLLHNAHIDVLILLPADATTRVSADHSAQLTIAHAMRLPIRRVSGRAIRVRPGALWIDGLFGTGLSRPITGDSLLLINAMHRARAAGDRVLALDVPSGIDADTGEVVALGTACVHADETVTFAALKVGMVKAARTRTNRFGAITVVDIGVPREVLAKLGKPVKKDSLAHLKLRSRERIDTGNVGGTRKNAEIASSLA